MPNRKSLVLILAGLVIAALIAGVAIMSTREIPPKKLNKEVKNENWSGCSPLSMCMTTGLFDPDTADLMGFSFWYQVPENKHFKNVHISILDEKENVIFSNLVDLRPGKNEIRFLEDEVSGVSRPCKMVVEVEGTEIAIQTITL